jgi:hypothetical protein
LVDALGRDFQLTSFKFRPVQFDSVVDRLFRLYNIDENHHNNSNNQGKKGKGPPDASNNDETPVWNKQKMSNIE